MTRTLHARRHQRPGRQDAAKSGRRERIMKKYVIPIAFVAGAVIALSVLLYPAAANRISSRSQSRIVTEYIEEVAAVDDGRRQAALEAAREYNTRLLLKTDRFKFTQEETAEYKKQLDVGKDVMGILLIDKIDVKLPIYHGTNEAVLDVGIGHLQGSSLPVGGTGTHAVITGHRGLPSSKLLSNLDAMAEGDTFALYVMGETLTYQVDQIKVVLPSEAEALSIDREMDYCTLVTCTPYGVNTHRLLVRGRRVESALVGIMAPDAKPLGKPAIILSFIALISPVLLLCLIVRCVKIHQKGRVHR